MFIYAYVRAVAVAVASEQCPEGIWEHCSNALEISAAFLVLFPIISSSVEVLLLRHNAHTYLIS